ncbi:HNH endonuclease [Moritella sp. Urea-trap-13]|uniref:HNH endonuclease n=1 Tax=Moritella sp. Urea-trap-13 TaxID=2058327 RepID=UPI000C3333FD|nr:HNH endonuclease [Moritella sp. Urea-trap-13]PKH06430.1 HNH endonuclease [Moritella sp. Urea-trap-13]
MRPVSKGDTPLVAGFANYRESFDYLLDRIGIGEYQQIPLAQYCSYCERVMHTNLAVEHIEPKKGLYAKPLLKNTWSNFLLACVNCNSKKGSKRIQFNELYFPDRDNTFYAFEYSHTGTVNPRPSLNQAQKDIAQNTIDLVGLNDSIYADLTEVAKDRRTQRLNVYALALNSLEDLKSAPQNQAIHNLIVKGMLTSGYFSIWMKVFQGYPNIKNMFIDSIRGTRQSGCFDNNANPIFPHPNNDNLQLGGKI